MLTSASRFRLRYLVSADRQVPSQPGDPRPWTNVVSLLAPRAFTCYNVNFDGHVSSTRRLIPMPTRPTEHCTQSPAPPQISLLGYSTLVVATNSSFMVLMFTNLPMIAELPALSFVPDALAPPNGCCPTTAPVLLQLM